MMKFKNGREIKENDPVVGLDWRNCQVKGVAMKGEKKQGHEEFVFQHATHKTVCPSLSLTSFLHAEDHAKLHPEAREDVGGGEPDAATAAS
jgi:hypothetical protein